MIDYQQIERRLARFQLKTNLLQGVAERSGETGVQELLVLRRQLLADSDDGAELVKPSARPLGSWAALHYHAPFCRSQALSKPRLVAVFHSIVDQDAAIPEGLRFHEFQVYLPVHRRQRRNPRS